MLLHVETRAGLHGDPEPAVFWLGTRRLAVSHIIDRWMGRDHSYFKLQTSDGHTWILRFDATLGQWELTLFHVAHHSA